MNSFVSLNFILKLFFLSSLELMLSWKFRERRQSSKMMKKIFKRDDFANQLSSIVDTDVNNYEDDSTMDRNEDSEENQPLVRFLPSGIKT